MGAHSQIQKPRYPGKVAIRHAFEVARDNGLDPRGFEVSPDGTIRIFDRTLMPIREDESLFDKLEREGKL